MAAAAQKAKAGSSRQYKVQMDGLLYTIHGTHVVIPIQTVAHLLN